MNLRWNRVRLGPKPVGHGYWINAKSCPPGNFVACAVQFAMMRTAKRHREFIANLAAEGYGLGEAQVMRV